MAETNLGVFANGVASYLTTAIFPAVVQGLANKGIIVTMDELLFMTNTPVIQPVSSNNAMANPSVGMNGIIPNMVSSIQATGPRKTNNSRPLGGGSCPYKFKRGIKKGSLCGNNTAPGNTYCNACLKSHRGLANEGESSTSPMPEGGILGGVPTFGSAYNQNNFGRPVEPEQGRTGGIDVVPLDLSRRLYLEQVHKLVIYQKPDNAGLAAVGRFDETSKTTVPLTLEEVGIAKSLGLQVVETSNSGSDDRASQQLPSQQFQSTQQLPPQQFQSTQQLPPQPSTQPQILSHLQGLTAELSSSSNNSQGSFSVPKFPTLAGDTQQVDTSIPIVA